jgi:selenide,water dikinase
VTLYDGIAEAVERLVFDPQTSGGLLMALPPANAAGVVDRLRTDGYAAAVVGEVREGAGVVIEP